MNKRFFLLVFLLFFVFSMSNVFALGVTPARTTIDFTPNLEKTIDFKILNSEGKDWNLGLSARGELADYVIISGGDIFLSSSEESRDVSYSVSLPSTLTPGLHKAEIVVLQKSEETLGGKASVGAVLGIVTQLYVYVPFPGKYIDGELSVVGTQGKKEFVISIVNRGLEDLDSIVSKITIEDFSGNVIKELETNDISLLSGNAGKISSSWDVDVENGKYKARAVVRFDGEEILFEEDFTIGELLLDLKQIFVKDFVLGEIAKFNIVVENKWSEAINGARVTLRVFDDSLNEISSLDSASYDIPKGEEVTMEVFWDTQGISQGIYNSNIILQYSGKKTQQDLKIDVRQNEIRILGLGYVISEAPDVGGGLDKSLIVILVTVIVVLVILNLLWFIVLRKRIHKGNKKK